MMKWIEKLACLRGESSIADRSVQRKSSEQCLF